MPGGFVLWFTGLSGSGKSTLTAMVAVELRRRGVHVETLDGDEIRKQLSRGLGFSRSDRDENIRRIGFVAKLVARSGACAITASISPYRDVRDEIRRSVDRFVEVYTECPISVLAERDPKGLYKKALAGEIKNFTGVDDPYEAPLAPEIQLRTDRETPEKSFQKILRALEKLELVPAWGGLIEVSQPEKTAAPRLTPAHGGELVDRLTLGSQAREAAEIASELPAITLDERASHDVMALATGAYSPLTGFMTSKDYLRVVREMRLESGLPWAVPITLSVPDDRQQELERAGRVVLCSPNGDRLAIMRLDELWRPDEHTQQETGRSSTCAGGDIQCLEPSSAYGTSAWRSPREVREAMAALGWSRVVLVQTASAPFAVEEYLARAALEFADGLLVRPTLSKTDELPLAIRRRCWEALLDAHFAPARSVVVAYPRLITASRRRLLIHDALVAKNFGASKLLVLEPNARSREELASGLDCYVQGELGIEVLPVTPALSSGPSGNLTLHSAPKSAVAVDLRSVIADLRAGKDPDPRFVRPEVLAILREHFAG